jgi:hypothetical protein
MVYTNCCMVYTIQKWYMPWGNLPDENLTNKTQFKLFEKRLFPSPRQVQIIKKGWESDWDLEVTADWHHK